jgi:subfamily B ATP-binding cassette protein MsbA
MGPSGVGKSTLVNLIPRLYDPTEGQILIDGVDIKKFTIDSLRNKIGIVTQEIILFNDTVRNNIAYGLDNISDELVQKVAKAAYAHDFIMELPYGYDTTIGEWGQTLSGGQRQRIAIARAILKNPEILILDEATTSLDSESEAFIQEAISNLLKGRTAFIITHHLASLKDIDFIAILEEGTVKAIGTHEFLLENEPLYSRLYELQMLD